MRRPRHTSRSGAAAPVSERPVRLATARLGMACPFKMRVKNKYGPGLDVQVCSPAAGSTCRHTNKKHPYIHDFPRAHALHVDDPEPALAVGLYFPAGLLPEADKGFHRSLTRADLSRVTQEDATSSCLYECE